jgi:hypothetical protein
MRTYRPKSVPALFNYAAKLIERDGWCKRNYWIGKRHCIMGALGGRYDIGSTLYGDIGKQARGYAAARGFDIAWNDHIAKSSKHVVTALREMAKGYKARAAALRALRVAS